MPDAGGASNVLLVVLDTVRKDHLEPYGYDRPTSPTLAAFAEEARVYEQAVAPAPWTLPVHASLFTGLYPSEHGATQESPYLAGVRTLAESASAAGIDTACYSANAWITPYTNLTAGFDRQDNFFGPLPRDLLAGPLASAWRRIHDSDRLRGIGDRIVQVGNALHERLAADGADASRTPAIVDRTIEFVDDADRFFAVVNLLDAHLPYHPPADRAEQFAPGVDSTAVCQNAKAYNAGAREIDDGEWEAIRGLYDAEIRHADAELGRLFAHLRATGRWADTAVIVCADHGELHGEHGLYGHEFGVYEPLVNVPLLVKHPAIPTGRDATTTVELLDLYHTVLDTLGVDPGNWCDSVGDSHVPTAVPLDPARSLARPAYREFDARIGPFQRGDLAFVEYHRPLVELRQLERKARAADRTIPERSRFRSRMAAVRHPDAKYVHNTAVADEAYRLDGDPGERVDRASDATTGGDERLAALADALAAFGAAVDADWYREADGIGRGDPATITDRPGRTARQRSTTTTPDDGREEPAEVLARMDDRSRRRLGELGYLE